MSGAEPALGGGSISALPLEVDGSPGVRCSLPINGADLGHVWQGNQPMLGWAPVVRDAYSVAGERRYRISVGRQERVIAQHELRSGEAWDRFNLATGVGAPKLRQILDNIVTTQAAMLEPVQVDAPYWAGDRLVRPDPVAVERVEHRALSGYGQVAQGAAAEHWAEVCELLAANPTGRGALYAGAALGGLYLDVLELDDVLDPLGFVVHAVGEGRQGKTTMQRVVAAILGNPANAPRGLVWSWGGSTLGLGELCTAAGIYPVLRSDTSTWRKSPAELGGAIMGALEGTSPVSGRRGGVLTRGGAYRSVIASSGNRNLTSTMTGTPILARVVELPGRMTETSKEAVALKRASRRGYGWPMAQVCDGAYPVAMMRRTQATVAAVLAGDRDPVAEDLAVRCSVLVAGAWALGELVGQGEPMLTAALRAAMAVLSDVTAALADSHRPEAQLLHAAVWEAQQRQPAMYASPEKGDDELGPRGRDGYYLAPTNRSGERLAVYPTALREIARTAGIVDEYPALRELRSTGHLVTTKPDRLTGDFKREGWGHVQGVYIFEALPHATSRDGGPETPETSPDTTSDQGSLRSDVDQGGRDAGRGDTTSDQGSLRSDEQVSEVSGRFARQVAQGEVIHSLSGRDLLEEGRRLIELGHATLERERAREEREAHEPAERAARRGIVDSWGDDWSDVASAPVSQPASEPAEASAEGDGSESRNVATQAPEQDEPPERHASGGAARARPALAQRVADFLHACPEGTSEDLARSGLERLEEAMGGLTFERAPSVVGLGWMHALAARHGSSPTLEADPELVTLMTSVDVQSAYAYTDPAQADAAGEWLVGVDVNAAYASAAQSLELGHGRPERISSPEPDVLKLPGFVLLQAEPGWPAPFSTIQPGRMVPTPLARLLVERLGRSVSLSEALVWPDHRRWLGVFARRCLDARAVFMAASDPASALALDVLKGTYSAALGGMLASGPQAGNHNHTAYLRLDWALLIKGEVIARLWRHLYRSPVPVAAAETDGAHFVMPTPNLPAIPATKSGPTFSDQPGRLKLKYRSPITPAIRQAIRAGSAVQVRELGKAGAR